MSFSGQPAPFVPLSLSLCAKGNTGISDDVMERCKRKLKKMHSKKTVVVPASEAELVLEHPVVAMLSELTSEEKAAIWYDEEENRRMEWDAKDEAALIDMGLASKLECARGLEHQTEEGYFERYYVATKRGRNAVFDAHGVAVQHACECRCCRRWRWRWRRRQWWWWWWWWGRQRRRRDYAAVFGHY